MLLGLALVASLAGCSLAAERPAPSLPRSGGNPCRERSPAPGDYSQKVRSGGDRRSYIAHVPPRPRRPAPVVLSFHGGGATPALQARLTGLDAAGDRDGLIAAYPEGTSSPLGFWRAWNAGQCCGAAQRREVDDVGFAARVIDDLGTRLCVDPRRVYASGMSNGGMMAHRLACDLSERVAAVASVAGALADRSCAPRRAIPILEVHGDEDPVVPYERTRRTSGLFLSAAETTASWRRRNRCPPRPRVDIGPGAEVRRYGPCEGGTTVTLATVHGGRHAWPGSPSPGPPSAGPPGFSATARILDFFRSAPRPARHGRDAPRVAIDESDEGGTTMEFFDLATSPG